MKALTRRHFIGTSVALLASSSTVLAGPKSPAKTLSLYNTHTGESLKTAFEVDGQFVTTSLNDLDKLLRDHRQNELFVMDKNLFLQLHEIQSRLGVNTTIQIISGYRSPATNNKLRKNSNGVAKKSYHMKGRAIDIRMTGVNTRLLRDTAIAMQAGGVGYYSGSDFVHLDTGPVRNW
jgi:uncharacterized protein YcbK (DUF882 family)